MIDFSTFTSLLGAHLGELMQQHVDMWRHITKIYGAHDTHVSNLSIWILIICLVYALNIFLVGQSFFLPNDMTRPIVCSMGSTN